MPPQAQQKKRQVGKAAIISDALPDLGSTSTLKIAELTTKLEGRKRQAGPLLCLLDLSAVEARVVHKSRECPVRKVRLEF